MPHLFAGKWHVRGFVDSDGHLTLEVRHIDRSPVTLVDSLGAGALTAPRFQFTTELVEAYNADGDTDGPGAAAHRAANKPLETRIYDAIKDAITANDGYFVMLRSDMEGRDAAEIAKVLKTEAVEDVYEDHAFRMTLVHLVLEAMDWEGLATEFMEYWEQLRADDAR